uniref:HTH La-type RNA-binding domain-containing protein n=1 Tax=Ascaris lumbricoides TaxID=6252 RepID=A0A9J2PIP8_ASCLU
MQVNANSVDRMMGDLQMQVGDYETPPTPALPWWFTPECENQLMTVSEPAHTPMAPLPAPPLPRPPPPSSLMRPQPELIKQQLKAQLEYYFSRENLMTDRFLRCQMDNDQYVPIGIIAGFPKVKRLTNDFNLIVQVLRESTQVQVDELGERVRAVSKRCTIILREIPESTDEKVANTQEVASMFSGGPPYISLRYGLNNSWYVTFESEEATQRAFLHLQNLGKTFNNKPICARIKTGGAPYSEPIVVTERAPSTIPPEAVIDIPIPIPQSISPSSSDNFDLGQILASYGYVPRATFKPGATVVHVAPTVNMNNSRPPSHRTRTTGHTTHYRGSNARVRGATPLNGSLNQREYNNSTFHAHHTGTRRGNAHPDGYRDRCDSYRPRPRSNRPNSFNYGAGTTRSRTPVEPNKLSFHEDTRQRSASDYDHACNRSKRDLLSADTNCLPNRNAPSPAAISTPDDDKKNKGHERSQSLTEDAKSESSSRKTEETEYNFEEGAFPCLSEEASELEIVEAEKPRERPSFSSVAAGKRKELKEKRSYAQTLKQNNGYISNFKQIYYRGVACCMQRFALVITYFYNVQSSEVIRVLMIRNAPS